MDYLEKTLGIKTTIENTKVGTYPNYLISRFQIKHVLLDEKKVIFLFPKIELESIKVLKKHIERIQTSENLPVVLDLKKLTFRQKEYLIRDKIPFIVEGKQIYLPFMATYLQERCDGEKISKESILPSAQMLFLYFIYNGAHELSTCKAVKDLNLTSTSISRASKQLEDMGLLNVKRDGVQKILFSNESLEDLFNRAKDKLVSPVKKTIYISKDLINNELAVSSYSALSEYSMLNMPNTKYYATNSISKWDKVSSDTLYDYEEQVAVEMWRYDPKKLSKKKTVDVLSLALALKDDKDERVEESIEEMLNDLWRKINGNGNN